MFTLLLCVITYKQFKLQDFTFDYDLFPWLAIVYAVIFATLYAYNAMSWAGRRLPPSIVTVYNTLQPIGTLLLSYIFLHMIPNPSEYLGGIIVCIGLMITIYSRCEEVEEELYNKDIVPTTANRSDILSSLSVLDPIDIEYNEFDNENNNNNNSKNNNEKNHDNDNDSGKHNNTNNGNRKGKGNDNNRNNNKYNDKSSRNNNNIRNKNNQSSTRNSIPFASPLIENNDVIRV